MVKVPPPGDDVDLQADIFDLSKDTKMAPAWMVFTALNGTFNLTFGLQGVRIKYLLSVCYLVRVASHPVVSGPGHQPAVEFAVCCFEIHELYGS